LANLKDNQTDLKDMLTGQDKPLRQQQRKVKLATQPLDITSLLISKHFQYETGKLFNIIMIVWHLA
jgi:hypothetical protein